jgi:hypothetical protein
LETVSSHFKRFKSINLAANPGKEKEITGNSGMASKEQDRIGRSSDVWSD